MLQFTLKAESTVDCHFSVELQVKLLSRIIKSTVINHFESLKDQSGDILYFSCFFPVCLIKKYSEQPPFFNMKLNICELFLKIYVFSRNQCVVEGVKC